VVLRDFLRLSNREKAPDHSWLSRTRSRLPHEAHETVFGFAVSPSSAGWIGAATTTPVSRSTACSGL
jgi:hypothetical protein